jgi:hypothetical protein
MWPAVAAIGLAATAGGIAYASIPDSGGAIHGCYASKDGALRVIDPGAGETCDTRRETALDWNQTGPQGPQGTQGNTGATGPAGPAGPQGPAGTSHAYSAEGGGIVLGTSPTDVVSVTVPDGTYVVWAQTHLYGGIRSTSTPEPFVSCSLPGSPYASTSVVLQQVATTGSFTTTHANVSLVRTVTLSSGGANTVSLGCSSSDAQTEALTATIVLLAVGGVN